MTEGNQQYIGNMSFANDDFSVLKLSKRGIEKQIEEEIKALYISVKNEIIDRDNLGFSTLAFELPENFTINDGTGLTVERSQVIIYSKLMMILESKGLLVGLRHTKNKTFLCVQWSPAINPEEEKVLNEYITERTILPAAANMRR